jgi:hypothetical protein
MPSVQRGESRRKEVLRRLRRALAVICAACTTRLWRGQGKRAAARELVDAKALLDGLA